jgi:uncharacterized protein (TIGR02757 family)
MDPHRDIDPDLKAFLDEKADQYNRRDFIQTDPVAIPHLYDRKEDIEIAGFLTATIAWGNRKSILQNAQKLMCMLGDSPFDFVMGANTSQIKRLHFVHRTFNSSDLHAFLHCLRNLYQQHGGLQMAFEQGAQPNTLQPAIARFKRLFFEAEHPTRSEKHVSDPSKGASAKRLNMMLRWFVRKDDRGVDLGIWNGPLTPAMLSCPLDVHTGNTARAFGLLTRTQNDAKALAELDANLRALDPVDPVRYDFALFGLGIMEDF